MLYSISYFNFTYLLNYNLMILIILKTYFDNFYLEQNNSQVIYNYFILAYIKVLALHHLYHLFLNIYLPFYYNNKK